MLVILASFEVIGRMVLDQKDSCFTGLLMSGIYENYDSADLKKLCDDYGKMIYYDYPTKHLAPNQHTDTVNINDHGFRGSEITKIKDENTFRIFVLGGSLTYGMFSTSDETTYSGYLQEKFDSLNTDYKIEVINAGVNAYVSSDVTHQIKTKLVGYEPDLLIAITGNDVGRASNDISTDVPFFYSVSNQFASLKLYYKSPEFFEFIKRVALKNVYGDQGVPGESVDHESIYDNIPLWKNSWIKICGLSEESSFDVLIAIPPLLGDGNKTLSNWESKSLEKLSHTSIVSSYHLVKDALSDLDKKCTDTVDLTNVFDDVRKTIYLDLSHVSDSGNMLIADELFKSSLPIMYEKMGE